MTDRSDNFLQGPLAGKLFWFAMPVAFTIICEQFVNGTDVLVLGQFVGPEAMAAVGNDMPVLTLLISLLVGLSLGANVLLAQAVGGHKDSEAERILHTAVLASILLGLIFAVIGELTTVPLLSLLGVPPEVQEDAALYLRIFYFSLPFLSLYNFEAALYRAMGDSLVDAATLFILLMRRKGLHLLPRKLAIAPMQMKQMIRIGLPAGIQGMVFSISNLVVQAAINSLGADVMAASSAAYVIEINIYAFVNSFGQAATTFVGQNFGALQLRRCFEVTKRDLYVGIGFVLSASFATALFAHPLISLFATDPEVIAYGVMRIYLVTGFQVFNCVIEILSGSLRGYGYSLPPALIVLFTVCGVRIIWVLTAFSAAPSFPMLLVCYPLSWFLTAFLLAFVYRSLRRQIFQSYKREVMLN